MNAVKAEAGRGARIPLSFPSIPSFLSILLNINRARTSP